MSGKNDKIVIFNIKLIFNDLLRGNLQIFRFLNFDFREKSLY